MLTIKEFCVKHQACEDGAMWAESNCTDMHDCWTRLPDQWLIWTALRPGVLSREVTVRFANWCAARAAERAERAAEWAAEAPEGERKEQATWLRENTTPNFD